ncbi:MAG: hypothetical protein K8U57_39650 [Planctomycetes bacterium]|nr:hypothetical protein [Planctomycetota bacterium]
MGNDRFLPEVQIALLDVLGDLPTVIHKALGEGKNNAQALVLKLRSRLPDLIGRISQIANDPLLRIREYATRETRLQEVGARFRVWDDAIRSDNAAIVAALDAILETEVVARRANLAPPPAAWLPHLLEAGRIIKERDYHDLVDPATRPQAEAERFAYVLLKTAATEPDTLPALLDELAKTSWPRHFTWRRIRDTLEKAVEIRIVFVMPREYAAFLDSSPMQIPLSVSMGTPAALPPTVPTHMPAGTERIAGVPPIDLSHLEQAKPDLFDDLRQAAKTLKLKGNQAIVVRLLCDNGGCVTINEVALACKWTTSKTSASVVFAGRWNSLRVALNKKFHKRKHPWNFQTHDKCPRVERHLLSAGKK